MQFTHDAHSPPAVPVPGIGDHATAISLYASIVTGLYRREKTGKGCQVSASLITEGAWATAAWLQAGLFGAHFSGELDRNNPPNALAGTSYQTSDKRWLILVFVEEDKNWPDFANAIGHSDWIKDARFVDTKTRHKNAKLLVEELDRLFATQSLEYWKKVLDKVHIPYGVVQIPEEIVKDPQLFANNIVVPIDDGSANPKYTVSSPVNIKESPKVAPRVTPNLGEHTDQVLQEIGYDKSAIEALKKSGVVPEKQKPASTTTTV
jgi:formyl-CoA transferase